MKDKVEIANRVAEEFKSLPWVRDSFVDDYNKEGSFQIVIAYDFKRRGQKFFPNDIKFSLANVRARINRILKGNNSISWYGKNVAQPTRTYERSFGQCSFDGYDKNYTMVDFIVL